MSQIYSFLRTKNGSFTTTRLQFCLHQRLNESLPRAATRRRYSPVKLTHVLELLGEGKNKVTSGCGRPGGAAVSRLRGGRAPWRLRRLRRGVLAGGGRLLHRADDEPSLPGMENCNHTDQAVTTSSFFLLNK